MKKLLFSAFIIITAGAFMPRASYAQQDVHFGTIFVEDIEVDQSAELQNINYLTDESGKQQELETLYKKEVGIPNADLKKINLNSSTRQPASTQTKKMKTAEEKLTTKVGITRNQELPKQIVYFVELRSFASNQSAKISKTADVNGQQVIKLAAGEIVKVRDTAAQYLHKLRMDRDNQGFWKQVQTREQDIQGTHFYYDWRNFHTITTHEFPIELDIMIPYGRNSIPVFRSPGAFTWKDCGLREGLCLDQIDLHAKAYLFDATIVDTRLSDTVPSDYRLFYKVGYQVKDKDGKIQHKLGWIPSKHAKRKITSLPKSLLATRNPNAFGSYESDMERMQRLQKYYIFDSNMTSENRTMNRWIRKDPGQSAEVFFQNIAFDFVGGFNTMSMRQTGVDDFSQTGLAVGVGVFAPIFIDLEIQGTAALTIPMSATETEILEASPIFRGEQWLLYTTPLSISGTPFKFGFGGYYMSMFASQRRFGFNSLVGFQAKGLFENTRFWTGFRYGPTGQDFGFKIENREFGIDFGYRLDEERGYESWTIYGDYMDTAYRAGASETEFNIISLGIRKQF